MAGIKKDANYWLKNGINKKALREALSNDKSRREIMAIIGKIKY